MQNQKLSLEKMYSLVDHFQDGIFVIQEGLIVYANNKLQEMIAYPLDEILQQPFIRFIHQEDRDRVTENYKLRQQGADIVDEYEFRLLSKDEKIIYVRVSVGVMNSQEGLPISIGTLHDITEYKNTVFALDQSQHDIKSILNNMPDVFYRTNMDGIITMISPSVKDALGYDPQEMIGWPLAYFYCQESDREKILTSLHDGKGKATQVEACLRHKDQSHRWISTNAYVRYDDANHPIGVEGIARDISQRKELEDRLKNFAQIDALTQLFNRRYFLQQAQHLLEIAKRYERPITALMIDLDSFKNINDTFGHHVGDEVLRHFSNCCKKIMRQTDIMGRLGGEEFAILSPETATDQGLLQANRIRTAINNCNLVIKGQKIHYTISIGVALLCPDASPNIEELLLRADRALYKAKEKRDAIEIAVC